MTFLTAATLLVLNQSAIHAAITVNYNAGFGLRDVVDATSIVLGNGNQVRLGYFDTDSGFSIASASEGTVADLIALQSHWHQFDATTITSIFGQPGRFAASPTSSDSLFDNKPAYFWIFKTSDSSAPAGATGFDNVQQYGIFRGTASNWIFPPQTAIPPANSITITSSEVNTVFFGSFDSNHLQLATLTAVPEPEAYAAVFGVGMLGFAVWRRRFHSKTA